MRRAAERLAICTLLVICSGCVHLSQPAPVIRDYRLAYTPPSISATALPVIIGVPALRVAAVYDRAPIVYREGEHATGTYFYSRWSANPGSMVADLLARDFAESGLYRAVQRGLTLLPIDYQLNGEIEEIEQRVTAEGCSAHLRLRLLLVHASGNTDAVRLRKTYSGDEPCRCDADAVAAAMSRLLERISAELQHDTHEAIAQEH
jgi:ABC-type uncharacterized transport system auxiliary subunit